MKKETEVLNRLIEQKLDLTQIMQARGEKSTVQKEFIHPDDYVDFFG